MCRRKRKMIWGFILFFLFLFLEQRENIWAGTWKHQGSTTYFIDDDGNTVTGWQTINKKEYYFYEDGKMAKNTWQDEKYLGKNGQPVVSTLIDGKTIGADGKVTTFLLTDVKCIAHRGLSGLMTENTLDAFQWAGQNGFWGAECDIWETADGEFAIIHDESLYSVFGINENITNLGIDEAQSHNVAGKDGVENYSQINIPTLDEYLNIFSQFPSMHPVIELKMEFSEERLQELLNKIKTYNLQDRVYFISFLEENLKTLRKLDEDVKLQYLVNKVEVDTMKFCIEYQTDLSCTYTALSKETVEQFHKNNILVATWTVNEQQIAREMVYTLGVDYITSNYKLFE